MSPSNRLAPGRGSVYVIKNGPKLEIGPTCTVVGWRPVFTRPQTVQIVLDSWQFLQDQGRLLLLGYVVLENHIHFIASAEDVAKEVGDFKSYTARWIIDYLCERHVRTLLDGLE
jgi:putative transposase